MGPARRTISTGMLLTEGAVSRQLRAMGAVHVDIGLREEVADGRGRFDRRGNLEAAQVLELLPWLRSRNARREHIYVRPSGERHPLVLLDDLDAEKVARMKGAGLVPAAVVETSPGNFQVWLRHVEDLDGAARRRVAQALAARFGADPSSTDSMHFGRLAGFTNPKPSRAVRGQAPYVILRESRGAVVRLQVPPLVATGELAKQSEASLSPRARGGGAVILLAAYHGDPKYGGDLHRADIAWAVQAARGGWDRERIILELLEGRDLAKKGDHARRLAYARRTAEKALAEVGR